jgi:hypothetical protein
VCCCPRKPSPYGIGLYKDYEELFQKNEKLGGELRTAKYDYKLALKQIQTRERQKQDTLRQNAALATAIAGLTREVDRLRATIEHRREQQRHPDQHDCDKQEQSDTQQPPKDGHKNRRKEGTCQT